MKIFLKRSYLGDALNKFNKITKTPTPKNGCFSGELDAPYDSCLHAYVWLSESDWLPRCFMVKINSCFKRRQIHGSYWIQIVYCFVLILLFNGSSQSHLGNYSLSWLSSNFLAHQMAFQRLCWKAASPSAKVFKIQMMSQPSASDVSRSYLLKKHNNLLSASGAILVSGIELVGNVLDLCC